MRNDTSSADTRLEPFFGALRAARLGKGWSQRDLAERAGLPQAHISRIESGLVDARLTTLVDLARLLDLELILTPRTAVTSVRALIGETTPNEASRGALVSVGQAEEIIAKVIQRFPEDILALQAHALLPELRKAPAAIKSDENLRRLNIAIGELRSALLMLPAKPEPRHLLTVSDRLNDIHLFLDQLTAAAPPRAAYSLDDD